MVKARQGGTELDYCHNRLHSDRIQIEERDIVSIHGTKYEEYRKQVSMLLPIPKKR
jgi:protein-S-isoprenylcysteine O-methyltransferase Ste14